ncbi:MAG TPA: hypothetical protein VIM86_01395, partial [Thermodesulfobacteriota bacterium]
MIGWIDARRTSALAGAALLALAGPASAQAPAQDAQQGARDAQQPGEAAERRSGSGQPLSDAWITAKTKLALYADEAVSGTDIDVDTSGAVVT